MLVHDIATRIRCSVANAVHQLGADDVDELTQAGVAIATSLLASAETRGKQVSAGNISYYAAKLVRQLLARHQEPDGPRQCGRPHASGSSSSQLWPAACVCPGNLRCRRIGPRAGVNGGAGTGRELPKIRLIPFLPIAITLPRVKRQAGGH